MGSNCCKLLKNNGIHPLNIMHSGLENYNTSENLTIVRSESNELAQSVGVMENESASIIKDSKNSYVIYEPKETMEDVIIVLFYDDSQYSSNLRQLAEQLFFSNVKTFCNIEPLLLYIQWIVNEKILLIIPRYYLRRFEVIYSLRNIDSIIVYQAGDDQNDTFFHASPKISKIFRKEQDMQLITGSIKEQVQIIYKNLLEISVFDLKQNSTIHLTKESASFLWYLTITDAVKEMNSMKNITYKYDQMMQICKKIYSNSQFELENIEKFLHLYTSSTALDWCKNENCTVSRTLKKALRIKDVCILYSLKPFLLDLINHLKTVEQQVTSEIIVYCGMKMTPKEISRFQNQFQTILICTNGFLVTTPDLDSVLNWLKTDTRHTTHLKPVIIEIKLNNDDRVTYVNGNNKTEIWFNLGTVFRIEDVTTNTDSEISKIHLSMATKDGFDCLLNYTRLTKHEFEGTNMIIIFGRLLFSMGQYRKAHEYYQLLLDEYSDTMDSNLQANIHRNIGHIYLARENLRGALTHYKHAVNLFNNSDKTARQHWAKTLIDISKIYSTSNQYENDIDVPADHITQYAERGIKILLENVYNIDNSITNRIFEYYGFLSSNNLKDSLHFFQLQLEIYQKNNEYSYTADILEQIGNIYSKQNDYKQAVHYFDRAWKINFTILPSNHPKLLHNLRLLAANVRNIEGNDHIFLTCLRKILEIEREINLEDHIKAYLSSEYSIDPIIDSDNEKLHLYNNGYMEKKINLSIWFRDFDTANCLHAFATEYFKVCDFTAALELMKTCLEIEQELVSFPDKDVASKLEDISMILAGQENYVEAKYYLMKCRNHLERIYAEGHAKIQKNDKLISRINYLYTIKQDMLQGLFETQNTERTLLGVAYHSRFSALTSEDEGDVLGDSEFLRIEAEDMLLADERRQIVIWIDQNQDAPDKKMFFARIEAFEITNLKLFNSISMAIAFMKETPFKHYQVVVEKKLADEFFETQKKAHLQNNNHNTLCVFVFEWNNNEEKEMELDCEIYDKYLSYLPCKKQCWKTMLTVSERCLTISNNRTFLFNFCSRPSSNDYFILMLFNHTKTNGCWIENLTSQVITPNLTFLPGFSITQDDPDDVTCPSNNPVEDKVGTFVRRFFQSQDGQQSPPLIPSSAGFQFNPDDVVPEIFEYLRIPNFSKKHEKFVIQITSIILFGRSKKVPEKHITDICRFFLRHKCRHHSDPSLYYKSLIHLWSLEQPAFYNLINKALAEANKDDLHLLRYIIYDYFMLFWTKAIPYYAGILYRGIHVPDDIINELYEFIGKTICFTCFTSTTKNRRRADVGGNVLFIIETISSSKQDIAGNNSNADISTISQFPEEEEVLYPPLTSFRLIDIQKEKNLYVIRLTEISGCAHMLMYFHDLKRRSTPNSAFTGLHCREHTSSYCT